MAKIVSLSAHLTAKQRDVVLLMAQGMSHRQISEKTGIALQTLYNWRSANTAFRKELAALQKHLYEEGIRALQGLMQEATSTLCSVMADSGARDADRIAAARAVLQYAVGSELGDRTAHADEEEEFDGLAQQIVEIVRSGNAG